jgi:hypothetical protein
MFNLLAGRTRVEIGAFATPNHENTKELFASAGFDPRPRWSWTRPGRNASMTTHQIDKTINEWLTVRHAIAHGHATLPPVPVVQVVREDPKNPPSDPSLRLVDAEHCLNFVKLLARVTGAALAGHLQVPAPPEWE